MKDGTIPQVALKAVLTAQNCFWTFAQLFQELEEYLPLHGAVDVQDGPFLPKRILNNGSQAVGQRIEMAAVLHDGIHILLDGVGK